MLEFRIFSNQKCEARESTTDDLVTSGVVVLVRGHVMGSKVRGIDGSEVISGTKEGHVGARAQVRMFEGTRAPVIGEVVNTMVPGTVVLICQGTD